MINYLKSILPRIQQHSKALDDVATFADIPWGFLDDDGHKVTYIFRRNNELLVSKQGEVVTGRWEYLPVMKSLLIEHEGRKRMYNQGYLNETIMLLRKDGTDELFPLGNVQLMPELDIEKYVEAALIPQLEGRVELKGTIQSTYELTDGGQIRIHKKSLQTHDFYPGNEVFKITLLGKDNPPAPDGSCKLKDGHELVILDGKITKSFFWKSFQTYEQSEILIQIPYLPTFGLESLQLGSISKGQLVKSIFTSKHGWIKLIKEDYQIKISQGKISKIRSFEEMALAVLAIFLLFFFILVTLIIIVN